MYPDPKSYRKWDPVLPPMKGEYGRITEVMPKRLGMRGLEQHIDPPTVRRYAPHDGGVVSGTRKGGS